ncbi:hypothetical protein CAUPRSCDRAFT_12743 [Caulochytrium protostelioides]|uniref:Uncharacterized protein n=1 Tax=Caulochytrium protostelioides TaxID=1555241 RepID=A0A4P9WQW3_9FUNG|nr:hypothetical protein CAUPRSCDRAFT_12743 [Caulochytrium protostelioides]
MASLQWLSCTRRVVAPPVAAAAATGPRMDGGLRRAVSWRLDAKHGRQRRHPPSSIVDPSRYQGTTPWTVRDRRDGPWATSRRALAKAAFWLVESGRPGSSMAACCWYLTAVGSVVPGSSR